jgi:hypothetical protein
LYCEYQVRNYDVLNENEASIQANKRGGQVSNKITSQHTALSFSADVLTAPDARQNRRGPVINFF